MQLYALNNTIPVLAAHAHREVDYRCPECGGVVRCRGGQKRQSHFYHIRRSLHCRQHGKSLAHLQIQLHLKSVIPQLRLEKRVGDRVADTLWEDEKIVFEVQCSPISLQEVEERCHAYQQEGYCVVWILHDRRFNRTTVSPAEQFLRKRNLCYFTNGRSIYDQFDLILQGRRLFRGPPLPVDVTQPLSIDNRRHFHGDWHHWSGENDTSHLKKIRRAWLKKKRRSSVRNFFRFLVYKLLDLTTQS